MIKDTGEQEFLERFAALVAAAERERVTKELNPFVRSQP